MNRVLFVCLGNICRSPAAEGLFLDLIVRSKIEDQFIVDSAGTIANHQGQRADSRMRIAASERNIDLQMLSRPIESSDYSNFDYIITMDNQNYKDVLEMSPSKALQQKVYKMTDFIKKFEVDEIPDPYFGGENGFKLVLDFLEDGVNNLLLYILHSKNNARR